MLHGKISRPRWHRTWRDLWVLQHCGHTIWDVLGNLFGAFSSNTQQPSPGQDMISLCPCHQLIGCCGQTAVQCRRVVGYMEFTGALDPPHPTALLMGCMNLASCPGQGLCLSHARLDPRHFIALTLPPTATAALNEAAHMCTDQVGSEPSVQLNTVCGVSSKHNAVLEPRPI